MRRLDLPWSERAIVISEVASAESWFNATELETVAAFHLEKRRQEWMLSRIAAKQLALDRGICTVASECLIEERRIGRWFVSLSHSGRYAGAAIDDQPVGIDVQVIRELKDAAAHLFLSDEETAAMMRCTIPNRLLHFWCAKEAAWKQRGGDPPTLRQIPLQLRSEGERGLRFDIAESVAIGDVIVALAQGRAAARP